MGSETFVTLTVAGNVMEANIIKSKLESEGFHCALLNENTLSIVPHYGQLLGGVKVQVFSSELEDAKALLNASRLRLED